MSCCLRASDEELETEDADSWECESCPLRLLQEQLPPLAWEALSLYRRLASRCVRDLRLTPLVFDLSRLRLTQNEGGALLDLLDLIHRAYAPASELGDPTDG